MCPDFLPNHTPRRLRNDASTARALRKVILLFSSRPVSLPFLDAKSLSFPLFFYAFCGHRPFLIKPFPLGVLSQPRTAPAGSRRPLFFLALFPPSTTLAVPLQSFFLFSAPSNTLPFPRSSCVLSRCGRSKSGPSRSVRPLFNGVKHVSLVFLLLFFLQYTLGVVVFSPGPSPTRSNPTSVRRIHPFDFHARRPPHFS